MSLRNSKTEKKKPRAMPVETIVTRFKSAQQKQQLEKELKLNTRKSKLIKPSKISQPPVKASERKSPRQRKVQHFNKKPEKFSKKVADVNSESIEYYPNKLKRKVLDARTFLAPKHSFKVICGTKSFNKRKLHMPQQDEKYIKDQIQPHLHTESPKKAQCPELTISDMVRMFEEDGSMDEEDLLEILTCPSPVWWEEPPDGYIEEPIISQPKLVIEEIAIKEEEQEEQNNEEPQIKQEESNHNDKNINEISIQDSIEITINSKDKNFINKRCHLESLLGNIRNKVTKPVNNNVNLQINESETPKDTTEDVTHHDVKIEHEKRKIKTSSECTEEDFIDFRDDDILEHLENIEIPIEENQEIEGSGPITSASDSIESNEHSEEYLDLNLLDGDKLDIGNEIVLEHDNVTNSNENEDNVHYSSSESSHCEDVPNGDIRNDNLNISTNISSSEANPTISDEVSNDSGKLTDKEIKYNVIYNKKEERHELIEIDNEEVTKDNDYVTIYKILNNEPSRNDTNKLMSNEIDKRKDVKDNESGKIDSFYKHCKKINNLTKTVDVNVPNDERSSNRQTNSDNKSIIISDMDNVKYCFICSSIFDTDKCHYCLRRTLKRKVDKDSCEKCGSDIDDTDDVKLLSEND